MKGFKYHRLTREEFKVERSVQPNSSKPCYRKPLYLLVVLMVLISVIILLAVWTGRYLGLTYDTRIASDSWKLSVEDAQKYAMKKILKSYAPESYRKRLISFANIEIDPKSAFDIEGKDVIVFLHIQKTAGTTLEKHLTHFLDLEQPCFCDRAVRKRCQCFRPNSHNENWLFSRFSTGWACGLHADWTELVVSDCVDNKLDAKEHRTVKRRYFYTTFLREPIARFISEYRHVKRGATWNQSRYICKGRSPSPEELPMCFDPDKGWDNVSLEDFISCPWNMARNRQTRMLADLTLVNCYDTTALPKESRDRIMLESAKRNLESMAFFGLQSEMAKSQFVFERTFDLRFTKSMDDWRKSKSNTTVISDIDLQRIKRINHLDLKLHEFAKEVFWSRYKKLNTSYGGRLIE